jgi:peptidoglycan-associated lipoprotein
MGSRELSLAADLTFGHSGSTGGAGLSLDVLTTVAGPRFTWKSSKVGKLQPAFFGDALFGVAHGFNSIFPEGSSAPTSASSFALMTGGGIDLPLNHWAGLRLLEADYVRSSLPNGAANVQNSFRIATGVTLRFR